MSDQPAARIASINIDRELCIGAASCVAVTPDGFELDDENKARVKPEWRQLTDEQLLRAAKSCPVMAIYLYGQDGQKIYPAP